MDLVGENVVLLATVRAVAVPDEAQILQHVEGAVDGRGGRGPVALSAAGYQLRRRYVALVLSEDLDQGAALGRPAQAARADAIGDPVPGAGGRIAHDGCGVLRWHAAVLSLPSIVAHGRTL